LLSPDDEFADYETWAIGNLDVSEAKTDDMLPGEYAREALKGGFTIENEGLRSRTRDQPVQVRHVGSTDSHNALATAQEDNFFGKHLASSHNTNHQLPRLHSVFDTKESR